MDGNVFASDQVIAELIGMGFEFSDVDEAVKKVGPSLDAAIEFILNGAHRNNTTASSTSKRSTRSGKALGEIGSSSLLPSGRMRQSSIVEHVRSANKPQKSKIPNKSNAEISELEAYSSPLEVSNRPLLAIDFISNTIPGAPIIPSNGKEEGIKSDWEEKVNYLLDKHFGYSSLKSFQKEALTTWLDHQDCLVLAATGAGKSLCFQIPALLTGKVVIVISPLISLMHDQCLKLAKHGVLACFLGSGQIDHTVEQKAMSGIYDIIYVCPETILRLIKPLQALAENRGIALFAIDEVHCVSKWGHDFRPDYRRLSILRENFRSENLKFLKFDIPLMALTATATLHVREDILKSLHMSEETKIVLTSFFRPNLRFAVKHSRTTSPSSYEKDFCQLIEIYGAKENLRNSCSMVSQDEDSTSNATTSDVEDEDSTSSENYEELTLQKESGSNASNEKKMSVEYLEDDCDLSLGVDDFDVCCGEFYGRSPPENLDLHGLFKPIHLPRRLDQKLKLLQGPLVEGPTIIYVPTRKETLSIAKFLSKFGVKSAAYNAKLPKSHLQRVHKEFHENNLQVVVATIAFGMGIDKSNVRRIIHYGWPQSLEAYYQEAGRAGRDGKPADCVLYANLSRAPTLLPNQRSEEQTKQAHKMLLDCFRYGMQTSSCRAKTIVQYFGEEFSYEKCHLCDVCIKGPPELQNLKDEARIFMQVIAAHYRPSSFVDGSYHDIVCSGNKLGRFMVKPNIKMFISRIKEQFKKFTSSDLLWWRGLGRILEDKAFIREADEKTHVQIRFPEPTELGLNFLHSKLDQTFFVYPEADMLLSTENAKPYSSFAEWGKGWADPDIRRQRLERMGSRKKPKKRKASRNQPDLRTVRGRLSAKLSKQQQ